MKLSMSKKVHDNRDYVRVKKKKKKYKIEISTTAGLGDAEDTVTMTTMARGSQGWKEEGPLKGRD